jgi:hypothetical protein
MSGAFDQFQPGIGKGHGQVAGGADGNQLVGRVGEQEHGCLDQRDGGH